MTEAQLINLFKTWNERADEPQLDPVAQAAYFLTLLQTLYPPVHPDLP